MNHSNNAILCFSVAEYQSLMDYAFAIYLGFPVETFHGPQGKFFMFRVLTRPKKNFQNLYVQGFHVPKKNFHFLLTKRNLKIFLGPVSTLTIKNLKISHGLREYPKHGARENSTYTRFSNLASILARNGSKYRRNLKIIFCLTFKRTKLSLFRPK